MKKELKGFVIGVITTMLLTSIVFASTPQMIEVLFNSVNIEVEGQKVDVPNILYNGTTYAPMRKVAEMLGKEVSWDEVTNTAGIGVNKVEENKKYITAHEINEIHKYGEIQFKVSSSDEFKTIDIVKTKNGTIINAILTKCPCKIINGSTSIPYDYYESTILPAIQKELGE